MAYECCFIRVVCDHSFQLVTLNGSHILMTRYEILMLAVPVITEDETKGIEKTLEGMIKSVNGEVISFERWGKTRLAYEVNKHEYGVYVLVRFEVEKNKAFFKEVHAALTVKYNDLVMRYVLVKLDPRQSLEYRRPHSVEDVPTRDVDSFLRENKMEGLITPGSSDKSGLDLDDLGDDMIEGNA